MMNGWWSHEILRIYNDDWESVDKCHQETFGFAVDAQCKATTRMLVSKSRIRSYINIAGRRYSKSSAVIYVTLQNDNDVTPFPSKKCVVHVRTPVKFFYFIMPKIITGFRWGHHIISEEMLVGDLLMLYSGNELTCLHQNEVCPNLDV